uniref:Uncharacterized protein n=1 Tax=viral metagenome TaxID=1070528 RepID=A0A6M3L931_9ZZZZ
MKRTKREIMAGVECVSPKIIDHNTVEYKRINGDRVIRLHLTDIITFKTNGDVVLNSGGWQTVTTKDRMNKFLPRYWSIYQKSNFWFLMYALYTRDDPENKTRVDYVYQDGITILGTGGVSGAGEDRKKLDKRLKQIKVYVDGFMKKLVARKLPQPSNGDCWYCLFKDKDGKTWGDMGDRSYHMLQHFEDKYYVPSLLMNAIKEIPISDAAKSAIGYWLKYHEERCESFESVGKEQTRKSLTRYLKRRLGMAA